MTSDPPLSPNGRDRAGINLFGKDVGTPMASTAALESYPSWTRSRSAAALVLRYLDPMRGQLIEWLGDEKLANDSLTLLIGHLVTEGFGTSCRGLARDFLIRGLRSAAKAKIGLLPESVRPEIDFSGWLPDTPSWLTRWRGEILNRAWRDLERQQHRVPTRPLFTLLRQAIENPGETPEMLAIRINTEGESQQVRVTPETIREWLIPAHRRFAELIWHEVAETLERNDPQSVNEELRTLGLRQTVIKLKTAS